MSSIPVGTGSPWFKIGRLEVTTVVLVIGVALMGWLVQIFVPAGSLAFAPEPVLAGEFWRVATWPFATPVSLFGVLNLFFFYWFGTELESQIGRDAMARFIGLLALVLVAVTAVVGLLTHTGALFGVSMIQFMVFLVWIAENARRPFFFGVPAWVIGAILLGLNVLTALMARDWGGLLILFVATGAAAMLARSVGLLSEFHQIPGRRPARPARPTREQKVAAKEHASRASDQEALDALLDKINESGIGSLTEAERKKLMKLRERLRGSR